MRSLKDFEMLLEMEFERYYTTITSIGVSIGVSSAISLKARADDTILI